MFSLFQISVHSDIAKVDFRNLNSKMEGIGKEPENQRVAKGEASNDRCKIC